MRIMKKAGIVIVLLIILGLGYGWYLYNKEPLDVRSVKTDIEVTADQLLLHFQQDENAASQQFVNKVMIVSGAVREVSLEDDGQATVWLTTNELLYPVTCSFYKAEAEKVKTLAPGDQVRIKGVCTGMLMGVVINKCSLEEMKKFVPYNPEHR